jgi:hypothetical protein
VSLRVFCVSLPKCGTHLLRSCLLRLGLDHSSFEVSAERELAVQATYLTHQGDTQARWFWGNAESVVERNIVESGFQELISALDTLPEGAFLNGHYAYDPRLAAALRERGIAVIVISRDPRAALLSMVDYVQHRGEPRELAQRLPAERTALLEALVLGTPHVRSLQENFDAYRPWLADASTLAIRFEDLVGPQGGGSLGRQAATISRIAQHVGLPASPTLIARAMHSTFDSASPTFFQGHSERWRAGLSAEVLSLVERHAAAAAETWGAPPVSLEEDRQETAAVLATWMTALATGTESGDDAVVALQTENARKQVIIDEWVNRAAELQAQAWNHLAMERELRVVHADSDARLALLHQRQERIKTLTCERDRAHVDNDARLALLHQRQERITALIRERDHAWADGDERLALIHRQQAALHAAIAERDRFAEESEQRLAVIYRHQALLAQVRAERDACRLERVGGRNGEP